MLTNTGGDKLGRYVC